jgi:hypothetical protein
MPITTSPPPPSDAAPFDIAEVLVDSVEAARRLGIAANNLLYFAQFGASTITFPFEDEATVNAAIGLQTLLKIETAHLIDQDEAEAANQLAGALERFLEVWGHG